MLQKSNKMIIPMQQGGANIAALLKGCNFSNCNVSFTGDSISTEKNKCKQALSYQAAELTEDISLQGHRKQFFNGQAIQLQS